MSHSPDHDILRKYRELHVDADLRYWSLNQALRDASEQDLPRLTRLVRDADRETVELGLVIAALHEYLGEES